MQAPSDEGRVARVWFDVWSVWCPGMARHRQNGAWNEPSHAKLSPGGKSQGMRTSYALNACSLHAIKLWGSWPFS
jgi:hypothetical protein